MKKENALSRAASGSKGISVENTLISAFQNKMRIKLSWELVGQVNKYTESEFFKYQSFEEWEVNYFFNILDHDNTIYKDNRYAPCQSAWVVACHLSAEQNEWVTGDKMMDILDSFHNWFYGNISSLQDFTPREAWNAGIEYGMRFRNKKHFIHYV